MRSRVLVTVLGLFVATVCRAAGAPASYVGMVPCRIADTREAQAGALIAGDVREFAVLGPDRNLTFQGGEAGGCPIPAEATAVVLNFTAVGATGAGHLTVYGTHELPPLASAVNFAPGATIANAVPVNVGPVDCPAVVGEVCGELRVLAGVAGTHVVIDAYGYFLPPVVPPPG